MRPEQQPSPLPGPRCRLALPGDDATADAWLVGTGALKRRGFEDGPALHVVASVVGALFAVTLSIGPDNVMSRYMTATDLGIAYSAPPCSFALCAKG